MKKCTAMGAKGAKPPIEVKDFKSLKIRKIIY
jgi:hypothetical protein